MSPRRVFVPCRAVALAVVALLLTLPGCARVLPQRGIAATVPFDFATDTFAFPNHIRAREADRPDLYANYCFVLARAVRQFHTAARFDPAARKLSADSYVERVRAITSRPPWMPPLPRAERVVIPGYPNLREFSRAEERAVKTALTGRFWTWVHWTNWRVTFPVTRAHQENVVRQIVEELSAGRLVQLLVTNWPKPELNHTVVAFGFRDRDGAVQLDTWDPNDPAAPGLITFDRKERRYVATRVFATAVGPIRVFRMYYSWLL